MFLDVVKTCFSMLKHASMGNFELGFYMILPAIKRTYLSTRLYMVKICILCAWGNVVAGRELIAYYYTVDFARYLNFGRRHKDIG